jgi:magnesium-protoporphyrin IX monomethyl ester (oxidative) cyclase
MYLNDCQRAPFYNAIGLDARKFDQYVIRKTNQSSQKLFPVILDVEHPMFFKYLDECAETNLVLQNLLTEESSLTNTIKKLSLTTKIVTNLIKLYFLPIITTETTWTAIQ